jgi:hypothetical protein
MEVDACAYAFALDWRAMQTNVEKVCLVVWHGSHMGDTKRDHCATFFAGGTVLGVRNQLQIQNLW